MPVQLAPAVRENIMQAIRHTVDVLLTTVGDVELYSMLAGLSSLAYGALSRGPGGPVPQPEQSSAQIPSPGHYL